MLHYINLPERLVDIFLISTPIIGFGIFLYSNFTGSNVFAYYKGAIVFLVATLGITLVGLQLAEDVAIRHPQWMAKFLLATLLGLPIWVSLVLTIRNFKRDRNTAQFKPRWMSIVSLLPLNLYSIYTSHFSCTSVGSRQPPPATAARRPPRSLRPPRGTGLRDSARRRSARRPVTCPPCRSTPSAPACR